MSGFSFYCESFVLSRGATFRGILLRARFLFVAIPRHYSTYKMMMASFVALF